ncbi:MAG TPA: hypothetical protein VFD38_04375 [Myxococcaceae bacterium]|nr:hypothetical protein [Myxococcaceae bacterium]
MAVLCLLPAVHPGDIQWVGDEPMLIAGALRANRQHVAALHGLTGTAGAAYGPFPTWMYQAYLLVSSDLLLLVVLRAVLMTAVIAIALLWLSRTLDLWPWFVPPLLCSPYLWFYARAIWDNTFNLPLCALAFASGVSFLARGRPWTLLLSLACCLGMVLTHLMSVAFVLPLGGFLLFRARRAMRRLFWRLALLAAAAAAVSFPYLRSLRRAASGEHAPIGTIADWLFPFLGGRILSAQRIEDIFGAAWLVHDTSFWAKLAGLATAVSLLALPLVWAGTGVALFTVWKSVRSPPEADGPSPRADAALLALLMLLGQVLLDGLTAKSGFTHYFNATWIAFAFLAWLAVDALPALPLRAAVAAVLAVSTLTVVLYLLVRIHHTGPARTPYGATLANQIEVARELNRYGPGTTVQTQVINVARFPIALGVLRNLYPAIEPPLPAEPLRLVYRTDDPVDGRIQLLPPGTPRP